jgi:hypothetical protein
MKDESRFANVIFLPNLIVRPMQEHTTEGTEIVCGLVVLA